VKIKIIRDWIRAVIVHQPANVDYCSFSSGEKVRMRAGVTTNMKNPHGPPTRIYSIATCFTEPLQEPFLDFQRR
jgi:hypothetical protein